VGTGTFASGVRSEFLWDDISIIVNIPFVVEVG